MSDLESFQPKLIYLTRGNPALAPGAFTARWRQHAALGMSLPRWRNIARYVHCDALHVADAPAELDQTYDGIGLIWHRSPQARAAHLADATSRTAMERDETATFAAPIVDCCVLAQETVLIEPRRGTDTCKLTCFRDAATEPDSNPSLHRALEEADAPIQGYVINTPLVPERGPWGLNVERIDEWWFRNVAAALRAAPFLRAARTGSRCLVLTNEVTLYG